MIWWQSSSGFRCTGPASISGASPTMVDGTCLGGVIASEYGLQCLDVTISKANHSRNCSLGFPITNVVMERQCRQWSGVAASKHPRYKCGSELQPGSAMTDVVSSDYIRRKYVLESQPGSTMTDVVTGCNVKPEWKSVVPFVHHSRNCRLGFGREAGMHAG